MSKFKKVLAGMLTGVSALACVAMVGNVNAATIEDGTVLVGTTSYEGDTKTWDFTTNLPKENANIAVGNDINGIVTSYGGDSSKNISIKKDGSGYSTYAGAEFLVPVPSASSTGTVTRTGNASSSRFLALGSKTAVALTASMTFDFATTDIETNPTLSNGSTKEGYYLRFKSSGGESKSTTISVQLKDGTSTYGSATVTHTVTYKDGDATLNTDSTAADGSSISFIPKKYGYDFEGWYKDAGLTEKIDSTYTVTENVTLYAKWTEWSSFITNNYELTQANIAKISTGIDGALTADLEIAPSIYTYMTGGQMTTTGVTLPGAESSTQAPCFNTTKAVSTSGYGLKFTAPANGTLTVYIGNGGGSDRSAKLTDGTNDIIPNQGAAALAFKANDYTPVELTFELVGDTTYYLGGTNGVRIYYVSFAELAAVEVAKLNAQFNNDTTKDSVRFIGTIVAEDLTKVTDIKITLTLSGNDTPAVVDFTTVYTSVSHLTGFEEAENTYYIVLKLTGLEAYRTSTLNATLSFKVGDVEHSASLAEALSLAV